MTAPKEPSGEFVTHHEPGNHEFVDAHVMRTRDFAELMGFEDAKDVPKEWPKELRWTRKNKFRVRVEDIPSPLLEPLLADSQFKKTSTK